MTIKDKRKPEGIFISDVPIGTVFEDVDGFFMKTDGQEQNETEIINLKTGETILCLNTFLVKPLNVELVIKDEAEE